MAWSGRLQGAVYWRYGKVVVKTIVKIHRSVRLGLEQYRISLAVEEEASFSIAILHLAAICDLLKENHGQLDGTVQMPNIAPPTFFVPFAKGWQLRYSLRHKGNWIWGRFQSITIHAIEEIPL